MTHLVFWKKNMAFVRLCSQDGTCYSGVYYYMWKWPLEVAAQSLENNILKAADQHLLCD